MLIRQFFHFPYDSVHWLPYLRWSLITILFSLFLWAYLYRSKAKSLANHPIEMVLPVTCAGLPFLIILLPSLIQQYFGAIPQILLPYLLSIQTERISGLIAMAFGEFITILGMLYLKSSFSIFSEARKLITTGIYQYIRHPLYLGEFISIWGYTYFYTSYWTLTGSIIFTILQCYRAKIEERKLSKAFPEYRKYMQLTGFLFPKFFTTFK